MNIMQEIINLTDQKYGVDVSKNLMITNQGLKFYSDNYFDWFVEGVIIYLPEFESEKGVDYTLVGSSQIFEYEHPNQPVDLYIRKDYDKVLLKYYPDYCIIDHLEKKTQQSESIYTSFLVIKGRCQSD